MSTVRQLPKPFFPSGNPLMLLRDLLGKGVTDDDFAQLFAASVQLWKTVRQIRARPVLVQMLK